MVGHFSNVLGNNSIVILDFLSFVEDDIVKTARSIYKIVMGRSDQSIRSDNNMRTLMGTGEACVCEWYVVVEQREERIL